MTLIIENTRCFSTGLDGAPAASDELDADVEGDVEPQVVDAAHDEELYAEYAAATGVPYEPPVEPPSGGTEARQLADAQDDEDDDKELGALYVVEDDPEFEATYAEYAAMCGIRVDDR